MSDKLEKGSTTERVLSGPEIPNEALKAAALGIHCRLSIGRGNFIGGQTPTPTSDDLARAALEAALPLLPARPMPTREEIAAAVYAGETRSNEHAIPWGEAVPPVRALFYDIAGHVERLLKGEES